MFNNIVDFFTLLFLSLLALLTFQLKGEEPIEIVNLSSSVYVGEIVLLGLEEIGVKNTTVTIVDLNHGLKLPPKSGFTVEEAYIVNPYKRNYTIFFNPQNDIYDTIQIISHELVHLKQFHSGRLSLIEQGVVVFDGDTTRSTDTFYLHREWEIEAFEKQGPLARKIKEKFDNK